MVATARLAADEADELWSPMGVIASSATLDTTRGAIARTDLRIDDEITIGSEWDEWSYEHQ